MFYRHVQVTCGREPIQICILRPNSANENAKKHCDALDALKQAVGIETDSEEAWKMSPCQLIVTGMRYLKSDVTNTLTLSPSPALAPG